jgi:hypothetical protein
MGFFQDVGGWFKGAATDVYNEVLKPVGTTVWGGAVSLGNRVVNLGENVADKGVNFLERQGNAINSFSETLSNPIFMIGAVIVAAIVLPKLLEK